MSGSSPSTSVDDVLALAHRHGLSLRAEGARLDTSGLDFLTLHADDPDGVRWIVRMPRRPAVIASAITEATVLAIVRSRLPVAVPDWRVHTDELIAYPRLGGTPWVTLDTGAPVWNVIDPAAPSDAFLDSCADALVALQAIPADLLPPALVDASIDVTRARLFRAAHVARELLEPSPAMWERWQRFLAGDSWPEHLALAHGDLHPGHMLLDEAGRLTGVLDWTEARVTDPGVDFVVLAGCFGRAGLERLVPRFERRGGRTWPRLVDHALERWAMSPALAAEWAHRTENATVLQFARDQLAGLERQDR
jgi:aminoglycoside phosphotransferase (APT) family kinase protein